MPPALAGRLFTTEPSEKSLQVLPMWGGITGPHIYRCNELPARHTWESSLPSLDVTSLIGLLCSCHRTHHFSNPCYKPARAWALFLLVLEEEIIITRPRKIKGLGQGQPAREWLAESESDTCPWIVAALLAPLAAHLTKVSSVRWMGQGCPRDEMIREAGPTADS